MRVNSTLSSFTLSSGNVEWDGVFPVVDLVAEDAVTGKSVRCFHEYVKIVIFNDSVAFQDRVEVEHSTSGISHLVPEGECQRSVYHTYVTRSESAITVHTRHFCVFRLLCEAHRGDDGTFDAFLSALVYARQEVVLGTTHVELAIVLALNASTNPPVSILTNIIC